MIEKEYIEYAMQNVLNEYIEIVSLDDIEALESHSVALFGHLTIEELEPSMVGLLREILTYRDRVFAKGIPSFFRNNFMDSPKKNFSREKKVETFEKKVQEIIAFMGGNLGTMKGNILKKHLREVLENADEYILPNTPTVTTTTVNIEQYLHNVGSTKRAIKHFLSAL